MLETVLLPGDSFEDALIEALTAHRNEVHQLRMALTVLAEVPDHIEDVAFNDEAMKFKIKQKECIRIAKLYADSTLLDHVSVDDVIGVLQEGLA